MLKNVEHFFTKWKAHWWEQVVKKKLYNNQWNAYYPKQETHPSNYLHQLGDNKLQSTSSTPERYALRGNTPADLGKKRGAKSERFTKRQTDRLDKSSDQFLNDWLPTRGAPKLITLNSMLLCFVARYAPMIWASEPIYPQSMEREIWIIEQTIKNVSIKRQASMNTYHPCYSQ